MLQTLGVSEATIGTGQFRIDVNVSVHDATSLLHTPRVEIKQVQSSKDVERAVEYEYRRLVAMLEEGHECEPQTRRYQPALGTTKLLRSNPEQFDYRYF